MARRRVVPDLLPDTLNQPVIQRVTFPQLDKEHDAHVIVSSRRPVLAYDQRFKDFRELFDLAVNFSGTDAYTAGV